MPDGLHVRRTAGGHLWQVHDARGARVDGPFGSRAAALAAIAEREAASSAPAAEDAPAVCVAADKQAEHEALVTDAETLTPGLTSIRRRVLVLARRGLEPVAIARELGRHRASIYDSMSWLRKVGLLPPAPPRAGEKPGPRKGVRNGRPEQRSSRARPASPRRFRPCITCGESFPSEGFHNRMCTRCRQGGRDAGPFDRDCSAGGVLVR